jgi:hypothetical protein
LEVTDIFISYTLKQNHCNQKPTRMRLKLLLILLGITCISNINAQDWQLSTTLYSAEESALFGADLSFNWEGNRVAISAPQSDVAGVNSGNIFVYEQIDGQWTQIGGAINGTGIYNYTGSLALSNDGNTLVIGSESDHNPQGDWTGSVAVYSWDGNDWIAKGNKIYGTGYASAFGHAVAINEDGSIILTYGSSPAHSIRAFAWNDTSGWSQKGSAITIPNNAGDTVLAGSIAMDAQGNSFVIGCPKTDNNIARIKVFSWETSDWIQKGTDFLGTAIEGFGHKVSMNADGSTILITTPGSETTAGNVSAYGWNGGAWNQKGQSLANFLGSYPKVIATSMDHSGDTIACWMLVGFDNDGLAINKVKAYSWSGLAWQIKGAEIPDCIGDNFGANFISLNAAGDRLAVGFPYDFNFEDSQSGGRVKIFTWDALGVTSHEAGSVVIYPNPTSGPLFLPDTMRSAMLLDLSGRLIKEFPHGGEVDISDCSEGQYILKGKTGDGIFHKKILVVR